MDGTDQDFVFLAFFVAVEFVLDLSLSLDTSFPIVSCLCFAMVLERMLARTAVPERTRKRETAILGGVRPLGGTVWVLGWSFNSR